LNGKAVDSTGYVSWRPTAAAARLGQLLTPPQTLNQNFATVVCTNSFSTSQFLYKHTSFRKSAGYSSNCVLRYHRDTTSRNPPPVFEPKVSLLSAENYASGHYPEPNESTLCIFILLKKVFNIIFPKTSRSTHVVTFMRDFRLSLRSKGDLRFSGMSCSVDRWLVYSRFGTLIGSIFKAKTIQEERKLDCLTLGYGTDRLSRKFGK